MIQISEMQYDKLNVAENIINDTLNNEKYLIKTEQVGYRYENVIYKYKTNDVKVLFTFRNENDAMKMHDRIIKNIKHYIW